MRREFGFSLMEAVVVMGILFAVIIAALPLRSWLQRQGVKLATEQLRCDLQLARLMAINRKRTCSIVMNTPSDDHYSNSISRRMVNLASYRGGVHFLSKGPDGGAATQSITFNRRGMAMSFGSVFLSNREKSTIYRIRVMLPGGIFIFRWSGHDWH